MKTPSPINSVINLPIDHYSLFDDNERMSHPPIKHLEYDYITDGIYIGTNHCCHTHFSEKLQGKGITANMSLEEERVDLPFGVDFYVWIPVVDHMPPTPNQLTFGAKTLSTWVTMSRKIFVHCKNGHTRAPTMVAAYLISTGKSVEESIAIIKKGRPTIHPTEAQINGLREFQKNLS